MDLTEPCLNLTTNVLGLAHLALIFGRKNCVQAYRDSLRNTNCRNVTTTRKFVAQLSIASNLHSTDYAAVFISQVQGILHMSSCSGIVGRQK